MKPLVAPVRRRPVAVGLVVFGTLSIGCAGAIGEPIVPPPPPAVTPADPSPAASPDGQHRPPQRLPEVIVDPWPEEPAPEVVAWTRVSP